LKDDLQKWVISVIIPADRLRRDIATLAANISDLRGALRRRTQTDRPHRNNRMSKIASLLLAFTPWRTQKDTSHDSDCKTFAEQRRSGLLSKSLKQPGFAVLVAQMYDIMHKKMHGLYNGFVSPNVQKQNQIIH